MKLLKAVLAAVVTIAKGEPVRVAVYGVVIVPLVALLVARGLIVGSWVPIIESAIAGLLGVPAVEAARSKVSPVDKAPE